MLREFRLERILRVLRDSILLAILRASLATIQAAVEALGLDEQGRRSVVAQLGGMLLPPEGEASEARA